MRGAPPLISEVSRPWWDALSQRRITMQRCQSCRSWVFYPRTFCASCGGRELKWTSVAPRATLFTYTIAHVPIASAFSHLGRPTLAIVELENGVRLATTIETEDAGKLHVGMSLQAMFDDRAYTGVTLLRFRRW
jgi:uncharacterized OB-fold protein